MGRNNQGVRTASQSKTNSKSKAAIEKTKYLETMKPLLSAKIEKQTNDGNIMIGFTKYGNKHLYSDTFGRANGFGKSDLANLYNALNNSTFVKSSSLSKQRKDGITKFYYFKDKHKNLYYNVAEEVNKGKVHRYVYSVTNNIK